MTKIIRLFVIILILFISCSTDDHSENTTKDFLVDGIWKLESSERFYFHNDIFDRSEISMNETDSNKLDFNQNNIVKYYMPNFSLIEGSWELKEIEGQRELITDLNVELPPASGYNTIYFFPKNKILKIDHEEMVLESIPIISLFESGSTQIEIKSYIKYNFTKE